MQQNYVQIIVFAILIAFSGLSWLFRKLKEQAEIKAAKDQALRRTDEMLRTGRDPESNRPISTQPMTGATEAQAPSLGPEQAQQQSELAERRREQLRQLRDRLAGKPPSQPAPGPVAGELWPGGPVVVIGPSRTPAQSAPPIPRPAPAATRPSAPGSPPMRAPQPFKPKKKQKFRRPEPSQQRASVPPAPPTTRQRQVIEAEAPPTVQREPLPIAAAYIPSDSDSWRQAIVAAEILSQPIGIRGPSAVGLHE